MVEHDIESIITLRHEKLISRRSIHSFSSGTLSCLNAMLVVCWSKFIYTTMIEQDEEAERAKKGRKENRKKYD